MKDNKLREKLENIQTQLRVRYCPCCNKWTLQHLTVRGNGRVAIPDVLGESRACRGDTWVWYCNNIDADRIN